MKPWLLILAAAANCTGCTMMSLNQNTLAQTRSAVDLRYLEILDNLALLANNRGALPSYATIFTGLTQITDTETMVSTTMWQHLKSGTIQNGFASETANPQLNRMVLQNWALDPIMVPEKLEAMRACYHWVLYGPQTIHGRSAALLASPDQDRSPGRHFGVMDRLAALPGGWLHVGRLAQVPAGVCYKARDGDTWVWVTSDGMKGLSDFALVIQDIARVDSGSQTLFNYPPLPSVIRFETADSPINSPDLHNPESPFRREIRVSVTAAVDQCGRIVTDQPYYRARMENIGSDAHFRSEINAAGATR